MSAFLQREIRNLKRKVLELGEMVETRVRNSLKAISEKDQEKAEEVVRTDYEIDEMEVDIEEECLKLLALYQPVASDLRFITAIIKINNDLERIADIAVNIANRTLVLTKNKKINFNFNYTSMIENTIKMLKTSLDCLVDIDANLARKVLVMDDKVDEEQEEAYKFAKKELLKVEKEEEAGIFINTYLISRHLERLADHCTNIAEEIIYMVDGEIIRHSLSSKKA